MASIPHFHYLDGWRGLAIAFLLVGHFFPIAGINLGAVGVNLFFVLSGVLMARLLFVQQVSLKQFYQRRFSRIFPAVVVFLTVIVGIHLIAGRPVAWNEVAAAGLFVNNYIVGDVGASVMPFGHFWSLCVEEHSYILLSLLAIAARRQLARANLLVPVAALLIGATALWYGLRYDGVALHVLSMHSEAAAFGIVASAALLLLLQGRQIPRLPAVTTLVLLLLGIALHWWSVPPSLRMIGGVGAFALAVNLLFSAPASVHALLSFAPLRVLGLWSFSLYIWQQPFYLLSRHHGWHPLAALAVAMCCGILSFYLVEQPARNWLNRRWGSKRVIGEHVQAHAA